MRDPARLYKFYNKLINDKRLHDILKKKGYKILFCLHPSLNSQLVDFKENEFVNVSCLANYSKVIKESKFLITDYSSVAVDFAYLKKPILYTQFDKDNFSDIHRFYRDGSHFDYEKCGFGEVVYDYESTINKIIDMINSDFKIKKIYDKRINEYFEYFDNNNSKRVFDSIIDMLKR